MAILALIFFTGNTANIHSYNTPSESYDAVIQAVASARLFASHHVETTQSCGSSTTIPPTGRRSYILQLPHRDVNRHFTHIFFRRSGIYLITICLEEMMKDPPLQFENLCYWLRQIQTYVVTANIKRVVIVGVHNTPSTDTAESDTIAFFLTNLDQAIQETSPKQIMEISREQFTLLFNFSDPDKSIHLLCQCVDKCVDVMIEQSWWYDRDFYFRTFQPFTQLTSIVSKISRIRAVIASTRVIEDCYNFTDAYYMTTLANYSHACISSKGNCKHLSGYVYIATLSYTNRGEWVF